MILELTKAECQRRGLHFNGPINTWDPCYYMNQGEETRYHEDQYLLNESFPMQVVTRGLLGISQELLRLTFDLEEGANVCHEDVRLYTVRDAASGKVIHRQVLPGPLPSVRVCGNLSPWAGAPLRKLGLTPRPSPGKGSPGTRPASACSRAACNRMGTARSPSWPL